MAVLAPLHTTHWGLLSQPDKQKVTNRVSPTAQTFRKATFASVRRSLGKIFVC
jgi:hypothetical protein